ncbi:MAG: WbqC family protein [Planctomycetes bacterium]|nr:WbqC family protein [Planctomycetota bacterium]
MILTGHQPNYLPYLGFFEKLARSDVFLIVDTVQFVKRGPFGWIHRNRIRTREGSQWLSVPTLHKGLYTQPIHETRINRQVPWGRKHWRALEVNYARAPHFAEHAGFFQELYTRDWELLADLNEAIIRYLIAALGIRVRVERLRDLVVGGEATGLIINFCRALGADTYLSGVHGRDYLDLEACRLAGLEIRFQDFRHPVYPQAQPGPFEPFMGAVDLLFNCGPRSLEVLLGGGPAGEASSHG